MKGRSLHVWRRMLLLAVVFVLGISASFAIAYEEKELKVDADEVRVENPDRAVIVKDGKYGLIDLDGKVIIPTRYSQLSNLGSGTKSHYFAQDCLSADCGSGGNSYSYALFDLNGKMVVPFDYQKFNYFESGEIWVQRGYPMFDLRLLDKDGKELLRLDQAIIQNWKTKLHEGPAQILLNTDGTTYINQKGEVVYSFPFPVRYLSDGMVVYEVSGTESNPGPFSRFADLNGNTLTESVYDAAYDFKDGYCIVRMKEKYGVINREFEEVIPLIYDGLEAHENGLFVAQKGKKYGLIDSANREILSFRYDKMNSARNDSFTDVPNILIVNVNGKYGLIDNTGKEVTSLKWSDAYDNMGDYFRNGLLIAVKAGKMGKLNAKGMVTIPPIYDSFPLSWSKGDDTLFLVAEKNGKMGIVSSSGEEVVPFEYEKVSDVHDFQTIGQKNGKWYVITLKPTSAELNRIKKVVAGEIDLEEEKKEAEKAHGEKDGGNDATGADAEKSQLAPNPKEAKAGSFKVMLDGKELAFDCYIIEGSTYYKLRDLAFALNGSKKQFSIDWDAKEKKIVMNAEKPYAVVGGEMVKDAQRKDVSVEQSIAEMIVNGKSRPFVAYAIGGNNYFKLHDIGKLFDFGVEWDDALKMIKLDTAKTYQE